MKKLLLITILTAAAWPIFAQEFRAPIQRRMPPRTELLPPVEGGLQRAARTGNPVQAVNPLAPRVYGTGEEFVYYDETGTFIEPGSRRPRPQGLRLFAFTW